MATVAELVAELKLQSEAFERKLDRVDKQVRGARKSFNDMTATVKSWAAGFLTVEAALRGIQFAARVVMEAEQASAKLDAVLKATGQTAGLTADDIKLLADQLERTTLFDDKELLNAAAVLATFRSVSGDTFEQTIRLAADLSAVFGQDLQSSVTMLGKALEDPVTGLTALRRVGVSFTETQRTTIGQLVESNKLFEAQKEILAGVAIQVQGAADAMGATGLTGSLNLLRDAFENALEANLGFATDGQVPEWLKETASIIERLTLGPRANSQGFIPFTPFFVGPPAPLRMKGSTVNAADLAGRLAPVTVTAPSPEREARELKEAYEDAARQLDRHNELVSQSRQAYQDAGQAALDALEAEEKARDEVTQGMRERAAAFMETERQIAESDAAERWAKGWGMRIDMVSGAFEASVFSMLTRVEGTWRQFAQDILSIWQRTLAQMIAMQSGDALHGFLTTLVTQGLGAAFGGGPKGGGFVDDTTLPGASPPGTVVASVGAPTVNVNLSLVSLDPRTHADLLVQQVPTIKAAVAEGVMGDRGFAHLLAGAGAR